MRDRAVEGLSVLARREKWRTSNYGIRITDRVEAALADENPVVRMHAAKAFRALRANATSEERIAGLRDLLMGESDAMVGTVLIGLLGDEAHESPGAVDAALEALANQRADAGESTDSQDLGDDADKKSGVDRAEDERTGLKVDLIAFLGLVHETPYALSTLMRWASNPAKHKELSRAIPLIRDYLAPGTEVRLQRAFEFIATASTAALDRWAETDAAHGDAADLNPVELSEFENVLHVLDTTADQIYFASGAFEDKQGNILADAAQPHAHAVADIARFADLATPTLLTCAASKASPVIHRVVETLIYLAQVDEKRGLQSLAAAVTFNSGYTYDSLAGGAVIPYLTRLLAEQRDLVLFDEEGVHSVHNTAGGVRGGRERGRASARVHVCRRISIGPGLTPRVSAYGRNASQRRMPLLNAGAIWMGLPSFALGCGRRGGGTSGPQETCPRRTLIRKGTSGSESAHRLWANGAIALLCRLPGYVERRGDLRPRGTALSEAGDCGLNAKLDVIARGLQPVEPVDAVLL